MPPFEPIPVTTREEMGQLARAVDDLHSQALTLAGEQARLRVQVGHMFETLSRRSTSLIDQQLSLIERLESDEEDPKRLQSLFRLDHLAARMRRNSDSLLVLAGTSTRRGVSGSISVADAIRAAVSEVENYERIDIGDTASDHVLGAVGSDLIHLVAEIVDNALAYSPPTTRVAIRGARTPDGGLLVEVSDRGLGMSPKDLAAINDQLAHGGDITADTARRMGLFVVGSLAKRHGIAVRLRRNGEEIQGITVSVHIPTGLLAETATVRPDRARAAQVAGSPSQPPVGPTIPSPSAVGGSTKSGLPTRVRGASGSTPIPDAAKKVLPTRTPGAHGPAAVNGSAASAKPVIDGAAPAAESDEPHVNGVAAPGEHVNGVAAPAESHLNGVAAPAEPHLNGVAAPAEPHLNGVAAQADSEAVDASDASEDTTTDGGADESRPPVARAASGLPVRKPSATRITEYREFEDAPEDGAAEASPSARSEAPAAKGKRLSWLPGRGKAAAEAARLEAEASEPRQMPSNLSAWLDHRAKLIEAAKERELAAAPAPAVESPTPDRDTEVDAQELHVPAEWVAEIADEPVEADMPAAVEEQPQPEPEVDVDAALQPEAKPDVPQQPAPAVALAEPVPGVEGSAAVVGLPTRVPGQSGVPTEATQAQAPPRLAGRAHTTSFFGARKARDSAEVEPQQAEVVPDVDSERTTEPTTEPTTELTAEPAFELAPEPITEPEAATETEPEAATEPEPEAATEPDLEAATEPETAPEPEPEAEPSGVLNDTPIFRAMMSRWLTDDPGPEVEATQWSPTEADQAWSAAARTEEAQPLEESPAGLPKRRPGNHLVPGAIEHPEAQAAASTAANRRDPEAIRRSLNRHQQGVSAARTETQDGSHREEADVHQ
ncbi:sensor histidine kinase KdpD [Nostocoides sp. HKS02]|uniref:sensor histidine kinase n=1 Tax=Nostocoides sp. HKS02 TaxID=1813880 RepID=UPI0012B4539F|nr:sensor histidine kinase [Tetrasphaera sp. HKS02]QGN58393.1 hypothetical protein GKE56_11430 [Tetrasphaera sp. HKS02]